MKRVIILVISFCNLLFVGCQRRADNVEFKLNQANHPITFTCSSIERGYSYLKRIFDPTGIGNYINENNFTFHGEGTLRGTYNNNGELEIWLYCHPRCYPIQATISWINKNGVKYTQTLTFSEDDFDIQLAKNEDTQINPTFVYMIHLRSDSTINIQKWQNHTLHGEKCSYDMQIQTTM